MSQAPTAAPAGESGNKNNEIRCTIDITCHHLVEQGDKLDANVKKYVPKNGVILSTVEVTVPQGSTVYDVLNQVCRSKGIKVDAEYTKIYETYYIKGIANLYEMQAGDMSGWMYTVNQVTPNVGCSSYTLKDRGCDPLDLHLRRKDIRKEMKWSVTVLLLPDTRLLFLYTGCPVFCLL